MLVWIKYYILMLHLPVSLLGLLKSLQTLNVRFCEAKDF